MEPRPVRKFVALVIAIVLVSAFVLYRGGASFLGGSKSNPVFAPVTPPPAPKGATKPSPPPDVMSGSKSTFIFVGDVRPPETPATLAQPDK